MAGVRAVALNAYCVSVCGRVHNMLPAVDHFVIDSELLKLCYCYVLLRSSMFLYHLCKAQCRIIEDYARNCALQSSYISHSII